MLTRLLLHMTRHWVNLTMAFVLLRRRVTKQGQAQLLMIYSVWTRMQRSWVRKAWQLSTRSRPDVSTVIAILTTTVRAPDINNWRKLSNLIEYLRVNKHCRLILSAGGSRVLMWYVNTSFAFAVHPNMRTILVENWLWVEDFPLLVHPSKSWTHEVPLRVTWSVLTTWCLLLSEVGISWWLRGMR